MSAIDAWLPWLQLEKREEPRTPTETTMTFQADGCGDHLCEKKECSECVDDRFKPLLEFEGVDQMDQMDAETLAALRDLGWGPEKGHPAEYFDEQGDSLLHTAARGGELRVMKELLRMGLQANVCCQGECCCSPLMVACRWCHPDCACLLLDNKADVTQRNRYGETAIDQAVNRAIGSKKDKEFMLASLHDRGFV